MILMKILLKKYKINNFLKKFYLIKFGFYKNLY